MEPRVFELRTYHAAPGKLDALNARFSKHTIHLFRKHGMTIIGFWTPADAEVLVRPTEHRCGKCGEPMEMRKGRRGPFLACTGYPECRNAQDVDAEGNPVPPVDLGIACEKCGSPMAVKRGPRGAFLGCTSYPKCRGTRLVPEELKEKVESMLPSALPAGEINETCPKEGESTLVYLLAYPSRDAADRSWQAFRDDPEWKAARAESERDGTLVEKVESVFLNPTDYSPLK